MAKVTLPPGCYGLEMQDGTRYNTTRAAPDRLQVTDEHAAAIRRDYAGQAGIVVGETFSFGTRRTRHCTSCNRNWNAWNTTCPACGETTHEQEPHQ
jgi:hypothetical protein